MTLALRSVFDMQWREIKCPNPSGHANYLRAARRPDVSAYALRTTTSGRTAIRYTPYVQDADHTHDYAHRFLKKQVHAWDAGYIVLVDQPVLADLRYGSYFVEGNGGMSLISESLYGFPAKERAAYTQGLEVNPEFQRAAEEGARGAIDGGEIFVSLMNSKSSVYFHMISESLLQAYVFARLNIHENVAFLSPKKRKGVEQILFDQATRFGLNINESSERFIWLPRAAFYSCFQQHARLNPDFRDMINFLKVSYDGTPLTNNIGVWNQSNSSGARIYVSRAGAAARPLDNEAELISLSSDFGFTIVDPGTLNFSEQLALFSQADCVIGPHGAGLTNAAFARSGATLIEFRGLNRASQSPSRNETYRRLSACMGLLYGCLMFDNELGSDRWGIDLKPVRKVLERIGPPKR